MTSLEIWALRDIAAGEFLTMDYASTEDVLARQFPCRCGSVGCRGWITGLKETPNAEGNAYLAAAGTGSQLPNLTIVGAGKGDLQSRVP